MMELHTKKEGLSEQKDLTGHSKAIKGIKRLIRRVSPFNYPVLISGESGVGKTVVARLIHAKSERKDKYFLHQSCSNIPDMLCESELFGHEKGAFTGAWERKKGKIEIADGGTLFLDEIGDLSLQNQAKLLIFLDKGGFFRVGGTEEIKTDVRVIAASNRNLRAEIKAGRFREDLYFRLNTLEIDIPALRERKEDIPLLVEEILRRENEINNTTRSISYEAMDRLVNYDFPGNIRELENIIRRAVVLSKANEIKTNDIFFVKGGLGRNRRKVTLDQAERTVQKYTGNKSKAARALGISRQALYKILKKKEA